jgi:hypothetical protein
LSFEKLFSHSNSDRTCSISCFMLHASCFMLLTRRLSSDIRFSTVSAIVLFASYTHFMHFMHFMHNTLIQQQRPCDNREILCCSSPVNSP